MLALCFFFLLQDTSIRPEYRFETVKGTAMNVITAMHQDRSGLLWFGTLVGLDRYDGHRFYHYRPDPKDPGSLSTDLVNAVCDDLEGNIWVATEKGLDVLRPGTNQFEHFLPDPDDIRILDVLCAADGSLWVTTPTRLYRRATAATGFELVHEVEKSAEPTFFQPLLAFADAIWYGTHQGLFRVNMQGNNVAAIRLAEHSNFSPAVMQLAGDTNGLLWIATNQGLFQLNTHTDQLLNLSDPTKPYAVNLYGTDIRGVVIRPDGTVWVGVNGRGIVVYDPATKTKHVYHREPGNPHCVQSDSVDLMMVDQAGVVWLSSSGFGLMRCNPASAHFQAYPFTGSETGPPGFFVFNGHETQKGQILVATSRGLCRFDQRTKRFQPIPLPEPFATTDRLRQVIDDQQGGLWLVVSSKGLLNLKADGTHVAYTTEATAPFQLPTNEVGRMLVDRAGRIWVGTSSQGLLVRESNTEAFQTFHTSLTQAEINPAITVLFEDRQDRLWVGTADNGFALKTPEDGFQVFRNNAQDPNSLPGNYVADIYQTQQGDLWIALINNGLARFNPQTQQIRSYNRAQGLADLTVYSLLEDRLGLLWMGTNLGISRFDPESESFVNFFPEDGLAVKEQNGQAAFQDNQGFFYFGGAGGMTRFNPEVVTPFAAPNLNIGHFKLYHGTPISIANDTAITFGPDQGVITFGFNLDDYHNPSQNSFAYRLEQLGSQWIDLDEGNEVTFTQLEPGDHRLEMIAANSNGVWNRNPVSLDFRVLPPWWQHPLANVLWFCLILLAIFLIWRWRMRKLAAQLAIEKAELKALQAQINPHFLFNTLNAIAELIAQKPEQAEEVVLQLSDYFREALNVSQNMVIRLDQEVQIIHDYLTLEKVRFGDRLHFSLKVDPELEKILIPGLIIQPLVENTMKYALPRLIQDGQVVVNAYTEAGFIIIECRDNGPGFPSNWRKQGFGLESVEQRLAHFFGRHARMSVSNEQGAVVRLYIPLKACRS